MKVIIQRVERASVSVDQSIVGSIKNGYLVYVCIEKSDGIDVVDWMAKKIATIRLFSDENGRMNRDIKSVNGSILSISQFTLSGTLKKGTRPSFSNAMDPENAKLMWQHFNQQLRAFDLNVETGHFGAHMNVELVNDGPVTIILERNIDG